MSDYTPNTFQVENAYSAHMGACHGIAKHAPDEFNRWLKSVKAEAWDAAAKEYEDLMCLECKAEFPENPYRSES